MKSTKRRAVVLVIFLAWSSLPQLFGSAQTERVGVVTAPFREEVKSSVIAAVSYDEVKRTLDVEFRSGAVWRYLDVLPEIHRAFLDADSKGRFYNAKIRHCFKSYKLGGRVTN